MANIPLKRAAEARRAKLELIRRQVRSGELVIRQMTTAERKKWAKQHAAVEAKLTPGQRRYRQKALTSRRASAARLLELEGSRPSTMTPSGSVDELADASVCTQVARGSSSRWHAR